MKNEYKKARIINYVDSMNFNQLSVSSIGDILQLAIDDKVTNLIFTEYEFSVMKRWMIYQGHWNWDINTFMGIKLEVI